MLDNPVKSSVARLSARLSGWVPIRRDHGFALNDVHLAGNKLDADSWVADYSSIQIVALGGNGLRAALKRLCDLTAGLILLCLLLPAIIMIALAIRMYVPGSVFDRRRCVGHFGKTFIRFRFRDLTGQTDPDIAWIGTAIRVTCLRELPQLVNVLLGDMSLVGPSANELGEADHFSQLLPRYGERACAKPGLTGLTQVRFCNEPATDPREKLDCDLYYVKHQTALLDATILLSTIWIVLSPVQVRSKQSASRDARCW